MGVDYDKLRATADRLLAPTAAGGNGAAAILRRVEETSYNPLTDAAVETSTDYTVNVVLSKVRSRDHDYDLEFIDKTYEGQALTKIIISAEGLPIRPKSGDRLIVGGEEWVIAGNNPVRPDATDTLHICYGVQ